VTCDIFNISSLAREIGICPSLLRKYKTGKEYISVEQKTRVVEGIRRIAKEISAARF
jgi:transposase-like protein